MKTKMLPLAVAVPLVLLIACSKPASQTAADAGGAAANAAGNATDAAANAAAPGGAVSPPESNGAVNTDANAEQANVKAGSNSFTEGQARGHIENAGYTDVTALTKTSDGLWVGKAKKDGKTFDVALDFKGAVSAK